MESKRNSPGTQSNGANAPPDDPVQSVNKLDSPAAASELESSEDSEPDDDGAHTVLRCN